MQAWSAQPIDGTILGVRLPASWRISVHADEHEPLRFGRFSSIAKSMAFWAFYTGAIASASIAGFSIVCGGRDAKPVIADVRSDTSHGTEADRSAAIADGVNPAMLVPNSDDLHAPKFSRLGEADAGIAKPLLPGAADVRETVPEARRETEAPQQSNASQPDAIEQLIDSTVPGDFADKPAVPVIQSFAAAPPEAPQLETGQPRIGEKPQIAARDKAKATASAPTENLSAVSPARASTAKRHPANTPRRSAEAKRYAERRPPGSLPRSVYDGPGAGSYYTDSTRGYGYGTYGPAPYSDRGD
jgi:hypothetical protein